MFSDMTDMMDDLGKERSIMLDIQTWVDEVQASVAAAGQQMKEDAGSLQEEHCRPRFVRNESIIVLIRKHLGYIEFKVK